MQKSFVLSLVLSFLFAFSTVAYLASPVHLKVQTVKASADELPATSTAPIVSFERLNLITLIEASSSQPIAANPAPAIPQTASDAPSAAAEPPVTRQKTRAGVHASKPVRLIIPSIGLDIPVSGVGINDKGEMDVPDASSGVVGWYKFGTIPGNVGSAVIDAHVYAAFAELRYVKVGNSIFVENERGDRLEFVVEASTVYKLGELTPAMLFSRRDARRLNLITCAGEPTADGSTYTHRLVVYTKLAA